MVKELVISFYISIVDNETFDHMNILEAMKKVMEEEQIELKALPNIGLIDAVSLPHLPFSTKEVIKGDDKSISIAAASVLAKVTRDRLMDKMALEFPQYAFDQHKGYGTKKHLEALSIHGPSPYHRKSFAPVMKYINR